MPLRKGGSRSTVSKNSKPRDQAVAIALQKAGKAKEKGKK